MVYLLAVLFSGTLAHSEMSCFSTLTELTQAQKFVSIQKLFTPSGALSMVNETKGSYFHIDTLGGEFHMAFYTSGLFDLFPVKREGTVKFCAEGEKLTLVGLDRVEVLSLTGEVLTVGKGGPRMRFRSGEMPEPLRKIHGMDRPGLATGND